MPGAWCSAGGTAHYIDSGMSKLGSRLIKAAKEARAITRGEADPATYRVTEPGAQSTLHLLRSPANAADLVQSVKDLDDGKGIEFDPTRAAKVRGMIKALIKT